MCHPGTCDPELSAMPTMLQQQREIEFQTVSDACWGDWLRERGIVLTNFRSLAASA
jgi:predicted glycoside hydrolase/deacetylase ChbG (UPF0249 family)